MNTCPPGTAKAFGTDEFSTVNSQSRSERTLPRAIPITIRSRWACNSRSG